MLTSILRRALRLMAQPIPDAFLRSTQILPEWSDAMAERHAAIWWKVKPYTMTSAERVVALCQSIAHIERECVPGEIVECGVWRGGSMLAAALALGALDSTHRQIWMYDTFDGMTPPGELDIDWQGRRACDLLRLESDEGDLMRARSTLADVQTALMQARYPWEKLIFVPGEVERTIPSRVPEQIALLRLDTDWYDSTYHELEHLYPRLADGGILIVDDYGHWQGARQAVDDYFRNQRIAADLRTIDFTGRLVFKRGQETRLECAA